MCTNNQCFRAKKKKYYIFYQKINIFTAVKYCCILHGRVCVMFEGVYMQKKYVVPNLRCHSSRHIPCSIFSVMIRFRVSGDGSRTDQGLHFLVLWFNTR